MLPGVDGFVMLSPPVPLKFSVVSVDAEIVAPGRMRTSRESGIVMTSDAATPPRVMLDAVILAGTVVPVGNLT